MSLGEEGEVCELVARVFRDLVAPDFEQNGIDAFFSFANPYAIAERARSGGFVLVAKQGRKIVGVLEFALPDRIAMLFVALRRRGIAKELLARALARAKTERPSLSALTVHSSRYAEPAYRKLGFRQTGHAATDHGITYIPMELSVA